MADTEADTLVEIMLAAEGLWGDDIHDFRALLEACQKRSVTLQLRDCRILSCECASLCVRTEMDLSGCEFACEAHFHNTTFMKRVTISMSKTQQTPI